MKEAPYELELWNGKEVVGWVRTTLLFLGKHVIFPIPRKSKRIKVPVGLRIVSRTRTDITTRICLDVRRKSERQIRELIVYNGGTFNYEN